MKLKILLTGKNGQLGRELISSLEPLGAVIALGHAQLDLMKPEQIRQAIRDVQPQLIVNAAAYTAVDQAESEEAIARAVNADAPGIMADEAKKIGAALIHYSTDYVFDGSKTTPYLENDITNPISAYGRTKLAGEQSILDSGAAHLIFRTAWVYGREGKNFLRTILRLATQKEELKIVSDQIGAPTSSRDIALATADVLSRVYAPEKGAPAISELSGIYHMTAGGQTNWHEFAKAILEGAAENRQSSWFAEATSQKPLLTRSVLPIATAEYPTPAKRPAYSVLSNQRLTRVFGIELMDWRTQLRVCLEGQPATLHRKEN
jgi:dTDP-4-dehydrorhamnose reductase